ncbi:DUF607-domain-containing protein [Mycena floridula]|nr:DUF607-domain-containing protein [Mycena floridula]
MASRLLLQLKCPRTLLFPRTTIRRYSSKTDTENTNVRHSQFIAEASSGQNWKSKGGANDFEKVTEGKGKLVPTNSHLVKLVLPLDQLGSSSKPPKVILLHPSQPLSHASRLILGSLSPEARGLHISFRSANLSNQKFEWSDSTDIGDFIRDAARVAQFAIHISHDGEPNKETVIDVEVPTFADRTRFLRRRLELVNKQLSAMESLKRDCDLEAHHGARRVALGGFGMLVVYWAGVCRLTFWDFGWEVMEPITYLSGLSTVMCGYLWFLYQGREVSYSSVLHQSISKRREALYQSRGFDIERWMDMKTESRALRREITKIAEDYDEDRWTNKKEEEEEEEEDRDDKEQLELSLHTEQKKR